MKSIPSTLFNDGAVTRLDAGFSGSLRPVSVAPLRASSIRRIEQVRSLVSELMVRDIGYAGIANLLKCSQSAARMYVQELRGAGIIAARPIRQLSNCVDKVAYRLNSDPQQIQAFLATLSQSQRCNLASPQKGEHVRRFHIMRDDTNISLRVSDAPAQRDPLVAALFGAPV